MKNAMFILKSIRNCIILSVIVAAMSLNGCYSAKSRVTTYPAEGIVTVDDSPAEGVTIQFEPIGEDHEAAMGMTDGNGRFKLTSYNGLPEKGAMKGEYKVIFSQTHVKKLPKPVYDPTVGGMTDTIIKNGLPQVYQGMETTPFTVTVTKGKNAFEFPLKSK